MARETAVTRWPKLVQSMVDDVDETLRLGESGCMEGCQIDEGRHIQRALRTLKEDIIQDQALRWVFPFFSVFGGGGVSFYISFRRL